MNSPLESVCLDRSADIPGDAKGGGPTRASKEPGRSAKDPGHFLASLNCASAQADGDSGGGLVMQRHDFALDTTVGPGVFSTSKVASWTAPLSCVQLHRTEGKSCSLTRRAHLG